MFKVGDKVKHTGVDSVVYEVVDVDTNSRGELCLQFKGQNGIWFNSKYHILVCSNERHKFADVIIAWANGAKVQFRSIERTDGVWLDTEKPMFDGFGYEVEYRVKPEVKPDVVREVQVMAGPADMIFTNHYPEKNVKFTFDGETGKLKKVELI